MSAIMSGIGAGSTEEHLQCDSIDEIEQLPVSVVPLKSLLPGFFLRQNGTDADHVRVLADAASTAELPPIIVQLGSMRVVDGLHRLAAAKLRGDESIGARFVDCTDESAFMLAVKANTQHGMPLSRADRIAGAERLLAWHPDWSDRALAALTGLGTRTIVVLRSQGRDNGQSAEKRLGRDGRWRPVASGEGRRRAAEYIMARPDASLREVARETDVSLGTVHDVRMRMRCGMDPTAVGRPRPASAGATEAAPSPVALVTAAGSAVPLEIFAAGAASARTSDPLPRRYASQEAAWQAVSAKLVKDPALRYTEAGRTFLRWMTLHAISAGEWKAFMEAIPPHWQREISFVANNFSNEWREFARELSGKQRAVS